MPTRESPWHRSVLPTFILLCFGVLEVLPSGQTLLALSLAFGWTLCAHVVILRYPLRFDRAQLAMDAAVQGLGVALESSVIAAGHLQEGRLVPLFETSRALTIQAHFVVYPARHAKRPEVETFVQWLTQQSPAAS